MMSDAVSAAVRYHGKTKPPPPTRHMVEFEALVTWTGGAGLVPPSAYRLENVAGKVVLQGDVLAYRIVFLEDKDYIPLSHTVNVRIAPLASSSIGGANGMYHRRRNGRPEVGFSVGPFPVNLDLAKRPPFIHAHAYDIVVDEKTRSRIAAIYFEMEDCDLTPLPAEAARDVSHAPPALGGGPLWRLGVNASDILGDMTQTEKAVWVPLPPLHPDPAVDPGVPIERRPQKKPRWYWFRSQGPKEIGGNLSGTKWYKMLGKFPKNWEDDAKTVFKGNPLTRSGRMLESAVALCRMAHHKHSPGTRYEECGTFPHPTIPNVSATPDAIIKLPLPAVLPAWFKELFTADQLSSKTMDLTRGVGECKTQKTRDKKTGAGARFKPEYFPQMYAEMICTGTWWGELTVYCEEANEMRTYPVYRKPDVSDKFEKCVKRMRTELLAGTPFKTACNHPTNVELIRECDKAATFYNKAVTPPPYIVDKWNPALVTEYDARCAVYDTVSSNPDDPAGKTIAEANNPPAAVAASTRKGGNKKTAGATKKASTPTAASEKKVSKKRERNDEIDSARVDSVEKVCLSGDNSSVKVRWKIIQEGTTAITRAIKADAIDMDLIDAMETQMVRYSRLTRDVIVLLCARDLSNSAAVQEKFDCGVVVPAPLLAGDDDEEEMAAILDEELEEEAGEMIEVAE